MADLSPIMSLFREWEATFGEPGKRPNLTNEEHSQLINRCSEIEQRMLALPSTTTADIAAKLIASTSYGGYSVDEEGPLIAEAKALVADDREHHGAMADLRELIDAFVAAKIAFNAMPDDDDALAEWETFIETELAIIVYPCSSIEDVRLKARFFLDHAGSNDELRNGSCGGEQSLDLFLRSLLGEAQPCA